MKYTLRLFLVSGIILTGLFFKNLYAQTPGPELIADPRPEYCAGEPGVRLGVDNSLQDVVYVLQKQQSGGNWDDVASITGSSAGAVYFLDAVTSQEYRAYFGDYRFVSQALPNDVIDDISVVERSLPDATIGASATEVCRGGIVTLSAPQAGLSYLWSPGNFTSQSIEVQPSFDMTYSLQVRDAYGCTDSDDIHITVNDPPEVFLLSAEGSSPAPDYCAPVVPRLNETQSGVTYRLLRDGLEVAGETLTGNGGAMSFGAQVLGGRYTVLAQNTHCTATMSGSIMVLNSPDIFSMTPGGSGPYCAGIQLGISGSETGVRYTLFRTSGGGETIAAGPVDGSGSALSFGPVSQGEYRVYAKNELNRCDVYFPDTRNIEQPPSVISLPAPHNRCAGSEIAMPNAEAGVEYYLHYSSFDKTDKAAVDGPVTVAAGQTVNFGPVSSPGVYTIVARNIYGCESLMDGAINIFSMPQAFELRPNTGSSCEAVDIRLAGSEQGVDYFLYRSGNQVAGVSGTGAEISFGVRSTPGVYTIVASRDHGNGFACTLEMTGSIELYEVPVAFTLRPLSDSCAPVDFGLDNTQTGVEYLLFFESETTPLASITGDGSAMTFGQLFSRSGTYYARARNANGCEVMMNGSRKIFPQPEAFVITPDGTVCHNDQAAIGLSQSEAGTFYTLMRSNVPVGNPVPGTGSAISFGAHTLPGVYTVIARSQDNCLQTMTGQTNIVQAPAQYQLLVDGQVPAAAIYCPGKTIGLSGSEPGVDYILELPDGTLVQLSGNGSSIDFPGTFTLSGRYTAYAQTTYCRSEMTGFVEIDEPAVFALISPVTDRFCAGDENAITLRLQGSQSGVTYQLFKDDIEAVFGPKPGTGGVLEWTGVSAFGQGFYNVRAYYPGDPACTTQMGPAVEIFESVNQVDIDPITALCAGESVDLVASAVEGDYTWYDALGAEIGNGAVITVTPPASTHFLVRNVNQYGCEATQQVQVSVNALPNVGIGTDGAPATFCEGGSLELIAQVNGTPGFSYEWFESGNALPFTSGTMDVSASGSYTVHVTDGNGCSQTSLPFVVTVHEAPDVTVTPNGPTSICMGEQLTLNAVSSANIVQYRWQNDGYYIAGQTSSSIQARNAGIYTVEVTNNFGCVTVSDGHTLVVNTLPAANAGDDITVCLNEPITLTATSDRPDVTFIWNHGRENGQSFQPATAGFREYTVTVRDNTTLCEASDKVGVSVNPLPDVRAGDDLFICTGESVTLRGRGENLDFSWDRGVVNGVAFSPLIDATYTVTGIDRVTGCSASDQVDVIVYPLPTIVATSVESYICRDQEIELRATGGVQYAWSHGLGNLPNVLVSPSRETTYTVTATDANGCVGSDHLTISVYPLLNAGDDQFVCDGEMVTLTASGGLEYQWSHGVINGEPFTPSRTETYRVTTTDVRGCSGTEEVSVVVNPLPNAIAGADKNEICIGEAVILRAQGGINYTWSHGAEQGVPFYPETTTIFTVTVMNENNCVSTDQIEIQVHPLPLLEIAGPGSITCSDPVAVLEALVEPGTSVQWSTGSRDRSIIVSNQGNYSVQAVSRYGCVTTGDITIENDTDTPEVEITGNELLSCRLSSIELSAQVEEEESELHFLWSTGEETSAIRVTQPGEYYVTVTASNGCHTLASVYVEQDFDIRDPFVPNAFRPGSEHLENQTFLPDFYCPPDNYRMQIFSRFGLRVFDSSNPLEGWDGRYDGKDSLEGVYVYIIHYDDNDGLSQELTGTLTLLR